MGDRAGEVHPVISPWESGRAAREICGRMVAELGGQLRLAALGETRPGNILATHTGLSEDLAERVVDEMTWALTHVSLAAASILRRKDPDGTWRVEVTMRLLEDQS